MTQWPDWVCAQLRAAVAIAGDCPRESGVPVSERLYHDWFNPPLDGNLGKARVGADIAAHRPLAGVYRRAHAGSAAPVLADGVRVLNRNDVVGRDGWWRTWNAGQAPTHCATEHVVFSPRVEAFAAFVSTVTAALLDSADPWLLACSTNPRRLERAGAAVLVSPRAGELAGRLRELIDPLLHTATPALCLPLGRGTALYERPRGAARFGEQRCHLVALGLRLAPDAPLDGVAEVFRAHGLAPSRPWLATAG